MEVKDILDLPKGRPRRLNTSGDRIFVAVAGGLEQPASHELVVLRNDFDIHRWSTPYLVSDVAAAGEKVWLALGPGDLYVSDKSGGRAPVLRTKMMNAPFFTVVDDDLIMGTRYGAIYVNGIKINQVKQWLYDVAANADRVFASYEDGICRVFERASKKKLRKGLSIGSDFPVLATAPGRIYLGAQDGSIVGFGSESLEQEVAWKVEKHLESPREKLLRLRFMDGHLVCVSTFGVRVFDLDGAPVYAWSHDEGDTDTVDALLYGNQLVIALSTVSECRGKVLRVTL